MKNKKKKTYLKKQVIKKRPPTEKEFKEATNKIMTLYAAAIKALANR